MASKKQQTFTVDGKKVKIVSQRKLSHQGNFVGYNIDINGQRYFSNVLDREDAIDKSYVKWVQENT